MLKWPHGNWETLDYQILLPCFQALKWPQRGQPPWHPPFSRAPALVACCARSEEPHWRNLCPSLHLSSCACYCWRVFIYSFLCLWFLIFPDVMSAPRGEGCFSFTPASLAWMVSGRCGARKWINWFCSWKKLPRVSSRHCILCLYELIILFLSQPLQSPEGISGRETCLCFIISWLLSLRSPP